MRMCGGKASSSTKERASGLPQQTGQRQATPTPGGLQSPASKVLGHRWAQPCSTRAWGAPAPPPPPASHFNLPQKGPAHPARSRAGFWFSGYVGKGEGRTSSAEEQNVPCTSDKTE